MDQMNLKAMAKINLSLDVVGRRGDGYHEVRMVMQTVRLYDRLKLQKTARPGIMLKTNLPYVPGNENNLVYKAARLLQEEFHLEQGIEAELEKYIPVAAGLAGGSSDAAAALYGMNHLFGLGLTVRELMERGARLGADVPYCMMRGTALSEGIGEVLTQLPPMPPCHVLIAKPGISVSTKHVYENLGADSLPYHPDTDGMIQSIREGDLSGIAERMSNVLETVTVREYPVIEELKQRMVALGAMNSLMSGSGPTVFGLFDDVKKAGAALKGIRESGLAKQVYLVETFQNRR